MSNLLPKPDQTAFQETAPGRQIRPGRSLPWLLAGLHATTAPSIPGGMPPPLGPVVIT